MSDKDIQYLLPFRREGNKKSIAASNGQSAKPKPVKVRFRRTGKIAIRVNGHWFEDVELDPRLYLSPACCNQASGDETDRQGRVQERPAVDCRQLSPGDSVTAINRNRRVILMGTCCLCNKKFTEFGNNPWPLATLENDGQCCDECNCLQVIPARFTKNDGNPQTTGGSFQ
jgi:hypothetical protein